MQEIELYKALIESVNIKDDENLNILDLGTGHGMSLTPILEKYTQAQILAIDKEWEYIEALKKRHDWAKNLICQQSDLMNKEVGETDNQKFDLITCHRVIEPFIDKEKFINYLFSLLKPNGYLIISNFEFEGMLFNSNDNNLTRKLIYYYITNPPWISYSTNELFPDYNETPGLSLPKARSIPGFLNNSDFKTDGKIITKVASLTSQSFRDGFTGYRYAHYISDNAKNKFSQAKINNWLGDLEALHYQDSFFFTIPVIINIAQRLH